MVCQFLSPNDALAIMSIPLSSQLPRDRLVWAYIPKGNFTIPNTYKVTLSLATTSIGEASSNQNRKNFQKTIWGLNVPNKIKSFAWQASKNIQPTKSNLCRRKVLDNPTCEACDEEAESSGHCLWSYPKAHEIQTLSGISFECQVGVFHEFGDLLWYLKFGQRRDDELLGLVITVAWCMWFNKNVVRQGKTRQSAAEILWKTKYLLEEFQTANFKLACHETSDIVQWIPPTQSWYKINTDGATFVNMQSTGVEVIIWDYKGQVEAALSKNLPIPLSPIEIEAKALDEGVLFAWDVGV